MSCVLVQYHVPYTTRVYKNNIKNIYSINFYNTQNLQLTVYVHVQRTTYNVHVRMSCHCIMYVCVYNLQLLVIYSAPSSIAIFFSTLAHFSLSPDKYLWASIPVAVFVLIKSNAN